MWYLIGFATGMAVMQIDGWPGVVLLALGVLLSVVAERSDRRGG